MPSTERRFKPSSPDQPRRRLSSLTLESLVVALGGSVTEREGSRVKITLQGEQWHCHRPHPGNFALPTSLSLTLSMSPQRVFWRGRQGEKKAPSLPTLNNLWVF